MLEPLIKEYTIKVKELYVTLKQFTDSIIHIIELSTDANTYPLVLSTDKKIKKMIKFDNISFESTEDIFKSLQKISDINNIFKYLMDLITKETYLSEIQKEMSNTYYESLKNSIKEINKNIKNIIKLSKKISKSISNNINDEIILNTDIKDFESIYQKYNSSIGIYVFDKYISVYKQNNIDVEGILQKVYDYVLGYNNEELNKKPYSNHPLLLMGLSFNLNPDNNFISYKDLQDEEKKGIIKINNKLQLSHYITFYKLYDLLKGNYSTVLKKQSINSDTVYFSKTIENNIIEYKEQKKPSIEMSNLDHSKINIYESLDGGNTYRSLGKNLDTNKYKYINMGPKPRTYLYNKKFLDIINNKKIHKTLKNYRSEYIDISELRNIDSLSIMYDKIKSDKKGDEELLYDIYKANSYLREIRKLSKNAIPQIPFTERDILNLF